MRARFFSDGSGNCAGNFVDRLRNVPREKKATPQGFLEAKTGFGMARNSQANRTEQTDIYGSRCNRMDLKGSREQVNGWAKATRGKVGLGFILIMKTTRGA